MKLDIGKIIEGGFPPGSVILIAGEPGTGKTIIVSSLVFQKLRDGKKVLFVSLNEPKEDYLLNMRKLGMNFENKNFKFMDFFTVGKEAIKSQLKLIYDEIEKFKPDIIVIDSVTAIVNALGSEDIRSFLHTSLGRYVKSIGATAFLIAEKPIESEGLGYGVEEFVVDGLIILRYIKQGEHYRRVLEIPKMRGRKIRKPQYEYAITGKGILLFDVPELERVGEATFERIATGIEKLDELTGGGYYKGAITLIAGQSGTGKTTFGLHFVYRNALAGRKAMFLTFEESIENVLRAMKNYGMEYSLVKENLIVKDMVPEAYSPVSFFTQILDLIETEKPEVIFMDSFSSIQDHMDKEELRKMVRYLQLIVKKNGIVLVSTLNVGNNQSVPFTSLSTLSDNIIFLRFDVCGSEVKRKLLIVKSRSSNHSRKIHDFEINNRGIVISG